MPTASRQPATLECQGPQCLSEAQLESYATDGFLVLRQFFEVGLLNDLARECQRLLRQTDHISRDNLRCRYQPNLLTGELQFEVFDPVCDISPVCLKIAGDPRLLSVMQDVYGEPACLFKDKLIFKPPRTKGYDLHQDFPPNWPGFPTSFVTVLIPVDPATEENGCTEVFAGYHHKGSLLPDAAASCLLPPETVDDSRGVKLGLQPGDVAIFGCFTPHRSAPNQTDGWRRSLFLSFNALSDGGNQRDRHYAEFQAWIRSRYPEDTRWKLYFR